MTEKETTSGGASWRKRAIASVSVAAAVCAAGVGFASSANAATPTPTRTNPTITVTAPKTLANDFTGPGQLSIEINNSQSGNEAIPGTAGLDNTVTNTATLTLNVTVPAGVNCNLVYALPESGTPAAANAQIPAFAAPLGGTSPNCTSTVNYTQPANSDYTYNYNFYVYSVGSSMPTGTVTTTAALAIKDGVSANVNTITSNSATTTLAPSAAPTLSTSTPPAATIYNDYSATVVTDAGTPSATPSDYSVFETPTAKDSDGTYPDGNLLNYTGDTVYNPTTKVYDDAIELEDDLYLDTITGTIVGNPSETDSNPEYSYTIIANNGTGGATAAQVAPANPGGNTAKPTPPVYLHDVQSTPFTIPVLFNDVTTTSLFGPFIYDLSDNDAIKGFADGSFRPGQDVTRQEFVNILVNYDPNSVISPITGTGACSTIDPSAFSDVPNSSVFCEAIKDLAQIGIVNGSGGKFFPSRTVSRQEIAGFIYRFYAYERTGNVSNGDAPFTSPSPFSDVTASNVFAGDIEFGATHHYISGYTDGTFKPNNATTRDAAAAVIDRVDFS